MKLLPSVLLITTSSLGIACDRQKDRSDVTVTENPTAIEETHSIDNERQRERDALRAAEQDGKDTAEKKRRAEELVRKATATIEKMRQDEGLKKLLASSKGVLILPYFGQVAVGVGFSGGEGILIAHREDKGWSDPAFFNVGGISAGAQLGAEGGEVALLLMDDTVVESFKSKNHFSLSAGVDFTLADYSTLARVPLQPNAKSVVFWSDINGAFAGVSMGVMEISWQDEENAAYYGKSVTSTNIIEGRAKAPESQLQKQLTEI